MCHFALLDGYLRTHQTDTNYFDGFDKICLEKIMLREESSIKDQKVFDYLS